MHSTATTTPSRGSWWDPAGFWYALHTLFDPLRIAYFRAVLGDARMSARVLDIGSGGGFIGVGLGDIARVTAVDRSHAAVREAHAVGAGAAVTTDAHRLPFSDAG